MLSIYDVMLEALEMMRGSIEAIDRRDADLARQIRRAASSVVLNVGGGHPVARETQLVALEEVAPALLNRRRIIPPALVVGLDELEIPPIRDRRAIHWKRSLDGSDARTNPVAVQAIPARRVTPRGDLT